MSATRIVIVGGGIAGLASAAALAPDHEVVLLERDTIAGDTTARASGVISLPLEPIEPEVQTFVRDRLTAMDVDGDLTFESTSAIRLRTDDTDSTFDGDQYDTNGLHARFPGVLGPLEDYTGGIVLDGAGVLDPLDLAMAYKRKAEAAGATILRDREVRTLGVEDSTVIGVDTELGPIPADTVVWTAGWRTADHLEAHITIPTRPMRWNAIVARHDIEGHLPIGSDPRNHLYWRAYGDDALLVGGNEHLIDDPADVDSRVDPAFVELVREALPNLLAIDRPLQIIRTDCCPSADTASPDGLPIIDAPPDGPDGLVVATGFHGRGIMLAPMTGTAVRAHITGERTPFSLDPFRLDRFTDRSRDFTYLSHWST